MPATPNPSSRYSKPPPYPAAAALPRLPPSYYATVAPQPSRRRTMTPDPTQNLPLLPSDSSSPRQRPTSSSSSSSSSSTRLLTTAALPLILLLFVCILTVPLLLSAVPRFLRAASVPQLRAAPKVLPGASVIAACANRHSQLATALPSWLNADAIAEVVLVDWSSSPPLAPVVQRLLANASTRNPNVRVLRVEGETFWVLSRAYNLAARHASRSTLLKLDCDCVVKNGIMAKHRFAKNSKVFYTGNYLNSRNANEIHLNGAMLVPAALFRSVGGYDERIQRYGYDDEDLYARMSRMGSERRNISYNTVSHLPHGDLARAQHGVRFPRVQIDVNVLLLERVNRTWDANARASEYVAHGGTDNVLKATYIPPDLSALVSPEQYKEVRILALGRRLNNAFRLPWTVISGMHIPTAEKLLSNFMERKRQAGFDEVVDQDRSPPYILAHLQNGLGNRIRTLGSVLDFARATNREPIIIWERDVHFNVSYADIFNASLTPFAVVHKFEPEWPIAPRAKYDPTWNRFLFYNYMLPELAHEPVMNDRNKNIYFKGAAILVSSLTSWERTNEEIRKLKIDDSITKLADSVPIGDVVGTLGGVHIRNRSLDDDIPGVADNRGMYNKLDAVDLDKWRATSKYTNFVPAIRNMLANGTVDRFFVASDTIAVCRKLKAVFADGKVMFLDRDCDDRGPVCAKYAMADLLVLAKSKVLLGSTWSSYTEAAMRLGGPKALMAGTDFGMGPKTSESPTRLVATEGDGETPAAQNVAKNPAE